MLNQKRPYRNDAAQGMKLAEQERMALAGSQRRDAFVRAYWSCRTGGCRHWTPCAVRDDWRTFYFNLIFMWSLGNVSDCNRIALKPLSSLKFRALRFLSPVSSLILLIPAKTPKTVSSYHCLGAPAVKSGEIPAVVRASPFPWRGQQPCDHEYRARDGSEGNDAQENQMHIWHGGIAKLVGIGAAQTRERQHNRPFSGRRW